MLTDISCLRASDDPLLVIPSFAQPSSTQQVLKLSITRTLKILLCHSRMLKQSGLQRSLSLRPMLGGNKAEVGERQGCGGWPLQNGSLRPPAYALQPLLLCGSLL